ncbi:Wadjet anti-phage system protein JetD domain-containing protein [Nocardia stercoris]|uniref:DUF3322 and DUF2220 domain-containing protein n=1 Tax=Nocardia stercoris TaxID=2483361 RepID=A0A3M2KW67_9NOCA|nr:Wadjet anti-phage system protein JetD domain-containing protein [Nocardia stercoris]RMI28463.1 hypothetical protein EBN03_30030 [Nocardia stercoris]
MTASLVTADSAVDSVRRKIENKWAEAVCAERGINEPVSFSVPLRPGISTGKAVERIGFSAWHDWQTAWCDFETRIINGVEGVMLIRKPVAIQGVTYAVPATLFAENLAAAAELVSRGRGAPPAHDIDRARSLAASLDVGGAILTATTLKAVYRLADCDTAVLFEAMAWLRDHHDVASWTARQLPVPGMHSKWLETHGELLKTVTGRGVRDEVRPRLAVVHLTYVDPDYIALSRRRHDAWTTGDIQELPYRPRVVLIVENRDCRLWFPPVSGAVIVEGGGKAAASLLAGITWIREAEHVAYWGDIDADGYAILDRLRAAMATPISDGSPARTVHSVFMDIADLHRLAPHGVNHDKAGRPLKPCATRLGNLSQAESAAYNFVATAGPAPFRRIEQEKIPLTEVAMLIESSTVAT